MTHTEAIEILRKHNEWRRYDGPIGEMPEMQHPALIGEAIDVVVAGKDNILPDIKQFRREAAKDVLCAMVANNNLGYYGDSNAKLAASAITIADELIKQLKEDEK